MSAETTPPRGGWGKPEPPPQGAKILRIKHDNERVKSEEMERIRPDWNLEVDDIRLRALACVARQIEDAKNALDIMEMLGLIDGKGTYIKAKDVQSHLNNPKIRGIGIEHLHE